MGSPNPLASLCFFSLLLTCFLCVAEEANSSSPKANRIGQGYRLISIEDAPDGSIMGILQVKEKNDIYGPDIPLLRFYVKYVILNLQFSIFSYETDTTF